MQQSIDWNKEEQQLGQNTDKNYFKPQEGKQKITFLDNGRKDTVTYDEDDGPKDVVVFTVEAPNPDFDSENPDNDEAVIEQEWTVNVANSTSSLYGQIARCAAAWEGLDGKEITLIRSGTGTDTQYTVVEAADL